MRLLRQPEIARLTGSKEPAAQLLQCEADQVAEPLMENQMEPGRERDEFVLRERRAGKTYKEIAAAIGRSTVHASALVKRAERRERSGYKPPDNFLGLSTRTANA